MHTYLFPGQGSQVRGMGEGLFDEFSAITKIADKILGYSIKSLCLEDKNQQLMQTQFTQPALYVVNALSYLKALQQNIDKPDFVIGHSLGEYNALYAAEVFDFETGLALVKKRGELMSKVANGGMAAVVNLTADEIIKLLNTNQLNAISIANYNSYKQFVISGPKQDIERAKSFFEAAKGIFIPLKVSGAFHTSYMDSAKIEFEDYLKSFTLNTPSIPILSNLHAKHYHPAIMSSNLANHLNHPVQWIKTIEYLNTFTEMQFSEIGPGKILTGLLNKIKNGT